MTPRKRAPGGGRKPKGSKAMRSQLTIRIPDDTRAQLEASARRSGKNLTDELLWRLRWSFAKEREEKRDPATRALTYLISTVADYAHFDDFLSKQWHRNRFLFRAFRVAVDSLLSVLEPPGEMTPPSLPPLPGGQSWPQTPEAWGGKHAERIFLALYQHSPSSEDWKLAAKKLPSEAVRRLQDRSYTFSNVRRDLGIDLNPKGE